MKVYLVAQRMHDGPEFIATFETEFMESFQVFYDEAMAEVLMVEKRDAYSKYGYMFRIVEVDV